MLHGGVDLVVDDSLEQALSLGRRWADLVDGGGAVGVVVDMRLHQVAGVGGGLLVVVGRGRRRRALELPHEAAAVRLGLVAPVLVAAQQVEVAGVDELASGCLAVAAQARKECE